MIITLCGSTRFEPLFHVWNKVLTLAGHTVFSLAVFPSQENKRVWYTDEDKERLDSAHCRKIDASDAVLILNRFAYMGESTLAELEYAKMEGKIIFFLESWCAGTGIGVMHTEKVNAAALDAGVLADYVSPVGTVFDTSCYSLLGEAGPLRKRLVTLLNYASELDG